MRFMTDCSGGSLTEQHHKSNCDVNNVMRRYQKTGLLPQRLSQGQYGDFSSVGDYHTCIQKMQDAHADFMAVPAEIRKRFSNDPAKLLEFVLDEKNRDEAIELGLIPKPVVIEPEVVTEPAAGGE